MHTHALPSVLTIMTIGAVTAVVVWGLVEVVKLAFRGKEKPSWYAAAVRLASMGIGAGVGGSLFAALGSPGFPWGTAVGAGAGALCTIIVAAVKRAIRARGEGE